MIQTNVCERYTANVSSELSFWYIITVTNTPLSQFGLVADNN